ncbi:dysbindin-A isoform X2 [Electrophorus electricus]|uniref:dysbindin-A isoform X2 n=1 Tax=Electrophorus electricus TaxID=8005 RepID=UPI000F09FAF1|nr:dysbindin-A isoform X2 [Electrophorus electricus]
MTASSRRIRGIRNEMFENFRERLQTVQQDFTSGIKTLSDKSKDVKVKMKQRREEHLPQHSAGVELLSRYEETWVILHKRTKECAKATEVVDGEVVMLSAHWERRRGALLELQEQLQQIPAFLADLETITARTAQLEAEFEDMEGQLMRLEDLCSQCEQQRLKDFHLLQLENYKKKKRKELESLKAELDTEHAQKVLAMEQAQQLKLKERQKYFEEAFQQDMEQYISTGYLQIADRRGSMSSMEVNIDMLEQMDLTDVSDHEALDVFLSSDVEENNAGSPTTRAFSLFPGVESSPAEISLKVPGCSQPGRTTSSISSSCGDTSSGATEGPDEEEDEGSEQSSTTGGVPLVQSDDEDVQADTALMGLAEGQERLHRSDDSDTQAP